MKRLLIFLALASCAFAGTWMAAPGKGSHAAAAGGGPTFIAFDENTGAAGALSIATDTTINVGTGNLVLAIVTYANVANVCTGVAVSGQAMTKLNSISTSINDFQVELWYLVNATANAAATVTATFNDPAAFRTIAAANWSGVATASATDGTSKLPTAAYSGEPNSGTSRTATNLTTTNANNLLVNFWVNWDNPATHTAATNWTLRSGAGATTVGMTDRTVSSTGTYPSANTATVSVADGYVSMFSAWKSL